MPHLDYSVEIFLLLLGILASCLCFSNAVENLGEKLNLSNQVTGSILAAVGTALPETIVPMVAIYMAATHGDALLASTEAKHGIAIGSIVGAPFLLGTLALLLTGITVILNKHKRKDLNLKVNPQHVLRDLTFFLITFSLAILASFFPGIYKVAFTVLLGLSYAAYLFKTIVARDEHVDLDGDGSEDIEETPDLYLEKLKLPSNLFTVILQTLIGLIGIIFFAEIFVHELELAAHEWNISPLILSLIITPVATELPEKVNSVIWSSQGKDTLAMGNITGAMVFQSSIPCAIGVMFTPWHLNNLATLCAVLAIAAALILYFNIKATKKLHAYSLITAGLLYFVYLAAIFIL